MGGASANATLEQYAQNKKLLVAKSKSIRYAREYKRTTRRWKTD